jgi:hypothetical protein
MLAVFFEELTARGAGVLFGLVVGAVCAWFLAQWRRRRDRLSILSGDARDTVVIDHHVIERADDSAPGQPPATLRIRSLGQGELHRVVPNGHLAAELHRRALRVTQRDTLISMEGAEGSYLLETLTNFVCDRVANAPFEHDLYVMAPCCEPAGLAVHQPISILLIAVRHLALFESGWATCRNIQVEHGSNGARILTLVELARRFRSERATIAALHKAGKRTRYVETMYVLDLALDQRTAPTPVKGVPWGRFEDVLRDMNLE